MWLKFVLNALRFIQLQFGSSNLILDKNLGLIYIKAKSAENASDSKDCNQEFVDEELHYLNHPFKPFKFFGKVITLFSKSFLWQLTNCIFWQNNEIFLFNTFHMYSYTLSLPALQLLGFDWWSKLNSNCVSLGEHHKDFYQPCSHHFSGLRGIFITIS